MLCRWRPQDRREAGKLKKIIAAAEQIIRDVGIEGLKVDQLTCTASCSTGSFYNLFKDRNAIILAVMEEFQDRTKGQIKKALDSGRHMDSTAEQIIELVFDFTFKIYSENNSLFRIAQSLHLELPELKTIGNDVIHESVSALEKIPCLSDVDACDLECMVRINIATFDHYVYFKEGHEFDPIRVKKTMTKMMNSLIS